MYRELGTVKLKSGEMVETAVIRAPDLAWADRLEQMLLHKGDPWNWQNTELLRVETGVKASFFVMHRGGVPFSNIMLVETAGVALLGHVWTELPDRRTGANAILMDLLLEDFRQQNGRAIFLGTGYDSPPFHYYRRRGFEPVEPGSGYMGRYSQQREVFDRTWFGATEAVVEPLDWPHWPVSSPLFLGPFDGVVRIAATQLIGRISEGPLLPLIREARHARAAGKSSGTCVLRDAAGPAMLGLASRQLHPLWPNTDIVDIFCHPRWWHRAPDLLQSLPASMAASSVAYCDTTHVAKREILEQAGFVERAVLPQWVFATPLENSRVDVSIFVRQ